MLVTISDKKLQVTGNGAGESNGDCEAGTGEDVLNKDARDNEPAYVARTEVNLLPGFDNQVGDDYSAYTEATLADCIEYTPPAVGTEGWFYTAEIISANDNYPFGSLMPGRKWDNGSKYRYGFNGKENDNDVKGEGNQQDYGMRIYDPRLGKFLSVDLLQEEYPELTPYQFASNNPIQNIDLDGLEGSDYKGRITNATPGQRNNAPVWSFFRDWSANILNYLTPAGAVDDAIDTWTDPNSTTDDKIDATLNAIVPSPGRGPRRVPAGGLHVEPRAPKNSLKGNVKEVTEKPSQATPVKTTDKKATQAHQNNTGAADANTPEVWTGEVFTGEKKLPINKNSNQAEGNFGLYDLHEFPQKKGTLLKVGKEDLDRVRADGTPDRRAVSQRKARQAGYPNATASQRKNLGKTTTGKATDIEAAEVKKERTNGNELPLNRERSKKYKN